MIFFTGDSAQTSFGVKIQEKPTGLRQYSECLATSKRRINLTDCVRRIGWVGTPTCVSQKIICRTSQTNISS